MRGLGALLLCSVIATPAHAEIYYLIVGGLGGEPRYEERFARETEALAQAAERTLGDSSRVALLSGEEAVKSALKAELDGLAEATTTADSLAVFLIGHGSYDGEQYKFNLPGPDISDTELVEWLGAVPAETQLLVNASSASGALLETWADEGHTLITATKSGGERNATRFGEHWAAALSSEEADANKNGIITAQEAFDYTEAKVLDSFESEGTLATEHPQLMGDAAERFTVARLAARVAETPQIELLMTELEALEGQIDELRLQREEMESDAYLNALQELLLELALVQRQIDEERAGE